MTSGEGPRRKIATLKREVRRAARAGASDAGPGRTNVNVSARSNLVVARNVGQPGTTLAVGARQFAPIRQRGRSPRPAEAEGAEQQPTKEDETSADG